VSANRPQKCPSAKPLTPCSTEIDSGPVAASTNRESRTIDTIDDMKRFDTRTYPVDFPPVQA